jgi:signal peptidase II
MIGSKQFLREINMDDIMRNKYVRLAGIALVIVTMDMVTKAIVLRAMPLYKSITVIPGVFSLTHIQNPGGAFGFLSQLSPTLRLTIFLVGSAVAIVLVFYFYATTPDTHPWLSLAFAFIFGGALGNLIDRLRFGAVVDFLDFYIGSAHWPAFNVADSAITIGITVFVIHLVFKKLPE